MYHVHCISRVNELVMTEYAISPSDAALYLLVSSISQIAFSVVILVNLVIAYISLTLLLIRSSFTSFFFIAIVLNLNDIPVSRLPHIANRVGTFGFLCIPHSTCYFGHLCKSSWMQCFICLVHLHRLGHEVSPV